MGNCKDDVLELIREALKANSLRSLCTCQYSHETGGYCDHCKINHGLRAAEACIVQGIGEYDLLRVRFIGVQEAIEDKLRAALKLEGKGGEADV